MAEHWIINEDDIVEFNSKVKWALNDGYVIQSSSSHWDFERNKTIYYALAINNNPEVNDENFELHDSISTPLSNEASTKEETGIKLSPIEYLLAYAEHKNISSFYTEPGENEIKPAWDEDNQPLNRLGRVWNKRRGFLEIAEFDSEGLLFLNEYMLSQDEIAVLTTELTSKDIKFQLLNFTEDNFGVHAYTLSEFNEYLNKMKSIQKERNDTNFFQWLFK
jgi:hypothetical protein